MYSEPQEELKYTSNPILADINNDFRRQDIDAIDELRSIRSTVDQMPSAPAPDKYGRYIIRKDDTAYSIAERTGITVDKLYEINDLKDTEAYRQTGTARFRTGTSILVPRDMGVPVIDDKPYYGTGQVMVPSGTTDGFRNLNEYDNPNINEAISRNEMWWDEDRINQLHPHYIKEGLIEQLKTIGTQGAPMILPKLQLPMLSADGNPILTHDDILEVQEFQYNTQLKRNSFDERKSYMNSPEFSKLNPDEQNEYILSYVTDAEDHAKQLQNHINRVNEISKIVVENMRGKTIPGSPYFIKNLPRMNASTALMLDYGVSGEEFDKAVTVQQQHPITAASGQAGRLLDYMLGEQIVRGPGGNDPSIHFAMIPTNGSLAQVIPETLDFDNQPGTLEFKFNPLGFKKNNLTTENIQLWRNYIPVTDPTDESEMFYAIEGEEVGNVAGSMEPGWIYISGDTDHLTKDSTIEERLDESDIQWDKVYNGNKVTTVSRYDQSELALITLRPEAIERNNRQFDREYGEYLRAITHEIHHVMQFAGIKGDPAKAELLKTDIRGDIDYTKRWLEIGAYMRGFIQDYRISSRHLDRNDGDVLAPIDYQDFINYMEDMTSKYRTIPGSPWIELGENVTKILKHFQDVDIKNGNTDLQDHIRHRISSNSKYTSDVTYV